MICTNVIYKCYILVCSTTEVSFDNEHIVQKKEDEFKMFYQIETRFI